MNDALNGTLSFQSGVARYDIRRAFGAVGWPWRRGDLFEAASAWRSSCSQRRFRASPRS